MSKVPTTPRYPIEPVSIATTGKDRRTCLHPSMIQSSVKPALPINACTSASLEPSYVLRAIGAEEDLAHSSIRFGIGRFTTEEEVDFTIDQVVIHVERLREMRLHAASLVSTSPELHSAEIGAGQGKKTTGSPFVGEVLTVTNNSDHVLRLI
ncbi:unnamed protein product [Echinostoma caproni]|uniref:Cysteine desulfurase n=1 Tax=Echinostoma caproni TaxID=27848 RepID=A0A183A7W7_9TREM|nr:unnamed protein product [Echinostoma caproni]